MITQPPAEPGGLSGSCFLALGMLGGLAATTEIRLCLRREGEVLTPAQARGALHQLAYRKPPLVEVARQGQAGFGQPNLWRFTEPGHVLLAGSDGAGGRIPCGTGWPAGAIMQ
jgi:hypothetical protein